MSEYEISDWTEGEVIEWALNEFGEETAKCFESNCIVTEYSIYHELEGYIILFSSHKSFSLEHQLYIYIYIYIYIYTHIHIHIHTYTHTLLAIISINYMHRTTSGWRNIAYAC